MGATGHLPAPAGRRINLNRTIRQQGSFPRRVRQGFHDMQDGPGPGHLDVFSQRNQAAADARYKRQLSPQITGWR